MDFPLLIFTDMDGTLLDHHSYSFKGAEEALQRLRQHSIPIILTSSKTRTELQALQEKLGLNEPLISENGGGIFIPSDYAMLDTTKFEKSGDYCSIQFGRPYTYIRKIFETIQTKYNIRGFGDMTLEEIMEATGLLKADAFLALQELQEEVAGHGLTVTRGGRFYHLMAAGQDKGLAVAETSRLFQARCPDKIVTIGLGDAENDYLMLKVVDIRVLIPKPDGSYENMDLSHLRKAPYPGSKGWGAAILEILDDFQLASPKYEPHRLH
jgi:mannosyl-3-phosphoglycerate phosphatase